MAVPRLEVQELTKSFRDAVTHQPPLVLDAVSFAVHDGEIVALIGPSGCGKTTVLRIIDGLLEQDAGDIIVSGHPVFGPGNDRGMVFQHAGLLPWRSALQNVEFGLELKKGNPVAAAQRREHAMKYLRLVGLDGAEHRYPHQLSGGMQQRVGLARALAIEPEVLLMDEPFSALDAQTKEVLQTELLSIHARTGKTILFVTHDLDEAVYLADRIVVMTPHPGRIEEIVPVDIPRPRPEPALAKGDPRFTEIRTHIWRLLKARAA